MIDRLDHLVLTTADLRACVDFYTRVLGMQLQTFGTGRKALHFGQQKINLHERGREFEPKAHAGAGCARPVFHRREATGRNDRAR
jgi:catechol 2,3-dioxygenase-like lactoylglutathione lyase family enzyme